MKQQQYSVVLGFDDGSEADALEISDLRLIKLVPISPDDEWDGVRSVFEWSGDGLVLVPPPVGDDDPPLTFDDFDKDVPF